MKFECSQCGLCCKLASPAVLDAIGLPHAPSGGCGHLLPDNTCAIYETRPDLCRVDRMPKYMPHLTWDQIVTLNHQACDELIEKHGDASTPRRRGL